MSNKIRRLDSVLDLAYRATAKVHALTGRRRARLMADEFSAGYRAGHRAGHRAGREGRP